MPTSMTVRFRLHELLAQLGVSQSEVARRSGVSLVTVSALVHNKTARVDLATLENLARALRPERPELRAGDLLDDDGADAAGV